MKKIVVPVLCLFILSALFKELHAQPLKLVLPIGHSKRISLASFSPDNKLIVTVSDDKTARIWELPFGRILATLGGHNKPIYAVTFSPDGQSIFTSADSVRKLSAISGRLLYTVKGSFPAFTERVITPDSKTIIITSDDSIYLRHTIDGQLVKALKIEGDNPNYYGINASFNVSGDRFLVTDNDKTVHIYRTDNLQETIVLKGHKNSITSAVFSPDDKYILTSSVDKSVKLWDAGTGKLLYTLITYQSNPKTAVFSPRSKYIITLSREYGDSARIWSAESGKLVCTVKGDYQEFELNERLFNQEETKVILKSDSYSNECVIVNLPEGRTIHTLSSHTEYVTSASFGPGDAYLVTTSQDKTATIWDPLTGSAITTLKGKSGGDNEKAYFSPDNKYFVITSDNKQSIWKTGNGNLVTAFVNGGDIVKYSSFSPDNKFLVTVTKSNKVRTWNLENGDLMVPNLARPIDFFSASYRGKYHFTADSKKFCIGTTDRGAFILDPVNGDLLTNMYDRETTRTDFSTDGNYVSTISKDSMNIWDGNAGTRINQVYIGKIVDSVVFIGKGQLIVFDYEGTIKFFRVNETKPYKTISKTFFSCFDTERTRLVTTHNNGTINIWDLENPTTPWSWADEVSAVSNTHIGFKCLLSGSRLLYVSGYGNRGLKVLDIVAKKIIADFPTYRANILDARFSTDHKHVLASFSDGTIKTWQTSDGGLAREFKGHTGMVNQVNYIGNEKRLISISSDNMAKVWEVNTEKELFSFFGVNDQDYLTLLPSGYYMSSRNAAKALYYVTPDLKVVTFEQLDLKYNRPDLVMKMADHPDTILIEAYRKAYQKRIRRMGVDTLSFKEGFSIPQTEFINRSEIKYNQNAERLVLHIKGFDSSYKLDRFNIWINEIPVYGQRGINIRKRNSNDFDTTITIKLSQGENRIEASISNVNGTESYRMPLIVNYTPAIKQKETIRFIGIGIDQFADKEYNLQYSSKDIRDLAKKLKEKYKENIIIDTLFNENVTISNVKALKQKLQQTTVNDKVIIAYSGHGLLSKEYDYYLSTYSINFDKPEQNGLPYDELENLLDSIPARKKLMLIDACHSGEVDKEDLVRIKGSSDSLIKGVTPVAYSGEGHLGLKNSFELMQSLFVNVGKSTGATIISAAAGTQFALERNDLKNGVFTYSILEAMNKYPTVKISELKKIVGKRVEELTKGLQKPTSRNETIAVDWTLW